MAEAEDAAAAIAPDPKRLRTLDAPLQSGVVRASLLAADSAAALRVQHDASGPYTHLVLRDVFDDALLRRARDEIINNVTATYKETDLFKVFQTGDLANLDALDPDAAARLPSLAKLRDALYSAEFRAFVRAATGCGELSAAADCSCNAYAKGGHLLCHDDVIGTRRVSYIVYLTDPDDPWTAEDGGALELYPQAQAGGSGSGGESGGSGGGSGGSGATAVPVPAVAPTTAHLPLWNSMAMFVVQPGKSFHSVEEVLTEGKPRLSVSGWYHAPAAPDGGAAATLAQLKAAKGADCARGHTLYGTDGGGGGSPAATLSEDDLALLRRWVNPAYLEPGAWAQIQKKFEADGSVQLQRFLAPEAAERVLTAATAADAAQRMGRGRMAPHGAGAGGGWAAVGPPHKQRYLRYTGGGGGAAADADADDAGAKAARDAGEQLAAVKRELFESAAFGRLLRALTTITMLGHTGEVRRFRPGLDYTVAHQGIVTADPRLDAVLTFVDDREPADAEEWAAGEVGGFEAYLLGDDDDGGGGGDGGDGDEGGGKKKEGNGGAAAANGAGGSGSGGGGAAGNQGQQQQQQRVAAETYRRSEGGGDDGGVINVPAAANGLNLLLRDEGLLRFVKYVSAAAPGSRWDVAMEYLPEDDDDDSDGGGASDE